MGILNEHASGPAPFQVMAKPTGPLCNLDCTYCFYLEKEKLYPGIKNWAMREDVLETYIRQYIESQPQPIVSFALQKEYAQGKRIENAVQTNGVTLDAAWAEFFAANDFLIGISVDGPRELH